MRKYIFMRILRSIFSLVIVTSIVMIFIFSLMDRYKIFIKDTSYTKKTLNEKIVYENQQFEKFGYVKMVNFNYYIDMVMEDATDEEIKAAKVIPDKAENDSQNPYIERFINVYKKKGYKIERLEAIKNRRGQKVSYSYLFAVKDKSVFNRLWDFFSNLISIDTVNYVKTDKPLKRYIKLEIDPFSHMPCLVGSGTKHKYLIYYDNKFPFYHQNIISINLGKSFVSYQNQLVVDVMNQVQGTIDIEEREYPAQIGTGEKYPIAADFHTATYNYGTLTEKEKERFTDDYTICIDNKTGLSMVGYSFIMGIISAILAYFIGIPLGVLMARKKDKFADKAGMVFIIFIMAVPSLAYIFILRSLGVSIFNLKRLFEDGDKQTWILPIISLSLPSIASLMKWVRRYMIDQENSDYVKFAKAEGLSEREIFSKHILRNAIIPITHGIPGTILGCLLGAIITERVYNIPGAGKLLVDAIDNQDNGMIVGLTVFYTSLSIIALLLGDILMAKVDPRISFSEGGGRK